MITKLSIIVLFLLVSAEANDTNCPDHCHCDTSGQCTSCSEGKYWGNTCDKACPVHCQQGSHSKTCKFEDGTCDKCLEGRYWGSTCENNCSSHCYTDGRGKCYPEDGSCERCLDGYHGTRCEIAPLPEECEHPIGDCSYYKVCMHQLNPLCPIITDIMMPKCNEYHDKVDPVLSQDGVEWSEAIRKCLQEKLTSEVLQTYGPNFECKLAEDVFFGTHIDCYMNAGPKSFCQLPASDKFKIVLHGADLILSKPGVATGSAADLAIACGHEMSEVIVQYKDRLRDYFAVNPDVLLKLLEDRVNRIFDWDVFVMDVTDDYAATPTDALRIQSSDLSLSDSFSQTIAIGFFPNSSSSIPITADVVKELVLLALADPALGDLSDAEILYNAEIIRIPNDDTKGSRSRETNREEIIVRLVVISVGACVAAVVAAVLVVYKFNLLGKKTDSTKMWEENVSGVNDINTDANECSGTRTEHSAIINVLSIRTSKGENSRDIDTLDDMDVVVGRKHTNC